MGVEKIYNTNKDSHMQKEDTEGERRKRGELSRKRDIDIYIYI